MSRTASNAAYAPPTFAAGTTNYSRNGLNQYTAIGAASPTYDARGNITYDGVRSYTYDPLNRLLTSSGPNLLTYDPLGRLTRHANGGGGHDLLFDGDGLAIEYNSDGSVQRRVVEGAGVDEPLVVYNGGDTSAPSWLYADALGSIVAAANAGGTSTQTNVWDEYGLPGSGNAGRFGFAGALWLPETLGTDIAHLRARAYSGTLGRFLQTDPISYAGGMNLYAYAGNDPVNFRDPTGLVVQTCTVAGRVSYCPEQGEPVERCSRGATCYSGLDGPFRTPDTVVPSIPDDANTQDEIVVTALKDAQCRGRRISFSFGGSLTGQAVLFGGSVSLTGTVSVPSAAASALFASPLDTLRGVQIAGTLQTNELVGRGGFLGVGTAYGVGSTAQPLRPGTSYSLGYHAEANLGYGESVGGSFDVGANAQS